MDYPCGYTDEDAQMICRIAADVNVLNVINEALELPDRLREALASRNREQKSAKARTR